MPFSLVRRVPTRVRPHIPVPERRDPLGKRRHPDTQIASILLACKPAFWCTAHRMFQKFIGSAGSHRTTPLLHDRRSARRPPRSGCGRANRAWFRKHQRSLRTIGNGRPFLSARDRPESLTGALHLAPECRIGFAVAVLRIKLGAVTRGRKAVFGHQRRGGDVPRAGFA